MARVNISMPDDIHRQAQRAGLNVSRVAREAVAAELDRLSKIEQLDAYLAELDAQMGPISDAEQAEASEWADRVLGVASERHSA